MSSPVISRRKFLKTAGVTVLASTLTVSGVGYAVSQLSPAEAPMPVDLPSASFGKDEKMKKQVLIAYASRSGSTAGVASAIAETLAERGFGVDVKPVRDNPDPSAYDAVVVGSAIQGQKWLPEAMQYVKNHRDVLRRKPFAAFLVCITLSMQNSGQYRDGVSSWLAPVRGLVPTVSEGLFAGTLDFKKMPLTMNTLMMRVPVLMKVWKEGDHRDWDAIHAWGASLSGRL